MVVDGFCFPEISFDSGVPQGEFYITMPRNATPCPPLKGRTHFFIRLMVMSYPLSKPTPILGCLCLRACLSRLIIDKISQNDGSNLGFIY